jgi:hypothetical protein
VHIVDAGMAGIEADVVRTRRPGMSGVPLASSSESGCERIRGVDAGADRGDFPN